MYHQTKTCLRPCEEDIETFLITIGLHHGSMLPLLLWSCDGWTRTTHPTRGALVHVCRWYCLGIWDERRHEHQA